MQRYGHCYSYWTWYMVCTCIGLFYLIGTQSCLSLTHASTGINPILWLVGDCSTTWATAAPNKHLVRQSEHPAQCIIMLPFSAGWMPLDSGLSHKCAELLSTSLPVTVNLARISNSTNICPCWSSFQSQSWKPIFLLMLMWPVNLLYWYQSCSLNYGLDVCGLLGMAEVGIRFWLGLCRIKSLTERADLRADGEKRVHPQDKHTQTLHDTYKHTHNTISTSIYLFASLSFKHTQSLAE